MEPTYDPDTDTVTLPKKAGLAYYVNGTQVFDSVVITEETLVEVRAIPPAVLREGVVNEWVFQPSQMNDDVGFYQQED